MKEIYQRIQDQGQDIACLDHSFNLKLRHSRYWYVNKHGFHKGNINENH